MRREHPELTVHRHDRARPEQREDRAQLLCAPVTRDVHRRVVLVQHLRARPREPVDRVVHAELVPGDGLRRDDHGVARFDRHRRVVVVGDARHRRHRLALASGAEDQLLVPRKLGELVWPENRVVRDVHVAEVARDVGVLAHRAADECDLSPALDAGVDRLLHAVHVRRERGDENAPGAAREDLAERLADDPLRLGDAGPLRVRRVAEHEGDASIPDLGELADVGALPVHRRVIELVVAGVHDSAAGSLEHDCGSIGNRMGHPDELDAERPEVERRVVRRDLAQVGFAHQAVLVELRLHEPERQAGPVHDGHAHLAHQIRQRPDMVFVAVREHDAADHVLALSQVREVGQYEVDAEMLVARKREAGVDDHDRSLRLVGGHVLPDLAQTAEGDDAANAH